MTQDEMKKAAGWAALKYVWRGDIELHEPIFTTVSIITQLCIKNEKPLFAIDYEDPDFDNIYMNGGNDYDKDNSKDEDDDDLWNKIMTWMLDYCLMAAFKGSTYILITC